MPLPYPTDVHRHDAIAFDVKHGAQVAFNVHRVNRAAIMSRKPVNFVGAQPWIKWILLENVPSPPRRILLTGIQIIEACPETFGGFEPVFHFRRFRDGGGAPLKTVSMSTKRPASASAIPCLNDFGIQESSFSTTNLATCARSAGGNPLNSAMTSCALMLLINHKSPVRASHNPVPVSAAYAFN